ncbi:squalene-associated fad-dependent desaturase : Squalene-associated FAD-dependent desaturase OS=Singulisphaera acidiphila (strain ATCC BAA-1392 / DSM 18658 / VKM B-2454 / MOB10) GN=Sinac_5222 PE=4 SV=1: Amino_oxidase [Gemmataceae bacterium]|nr:squalene-associated fad-dependent desaturase : Squalene-associated FAD-dependent desaturase OS=Singulisphaera acidiphila (strain ATCC BAA-1392 / DSM 18658 / VKM B-2454 / MOB10) GN=Sinac_5222 PE=4 SV=1: Amino_oxidase [Gemmataceae bacterium]VTU00126.1 squalene-associated fad-dependent desaturase : Squalene-associated FAD-dependent desaturase OS=Singulisphaera acidiphila (strain ATCC BAA-1392 / DSM 18658 / VKM B-2454 / MOB10) GN=Sinac_5222 PE=4 SV=1: Amino_oxidase [Gemmataceae bacterium]
MARVAVIGGGLAGLAAAAALAARGFGVTVVESRRRLGGRASSFPDPASGQLVDACQHASMGCCTNLDHFFATVGVSGLLARQPKLNFVTPDRRKSVFKADPWPAPLHLGRALLGAHYLTPAEKVRVGLGFAALLRESPDADPPLKDWLLRHHQTERTIARFWGVVLVSALNETVDRLGLKYARKVFVDGFLRHRDGFVVHLPTVPLGRLYSDELRGWFARHGVEFREGVAVRDLVSTRSGISHLTMRDGTTITADWYVLAVPFERVLDLLPGELAADPYFAGVANLEPSPITSVHLWLDRPVTPLQHAVLVDCLGHWVFNRGEVAPGEFYLQVVISATRDLSALGNDEIGSRVAAELGRLFPEMARARVLRSKVVTERTATFSAVPGVDRWRPPQGSPVPNLAVAGDWTATGWPATMEGAVRSGYLAAEAILTRAGRPERVVRPELWEARSPGEP